MTCWGILWFDGSFYLWFWKDISLYYIYFKIQMNIGWAYKNVKNIQATVERFVKLFSREMELSSRKVTQLLYTLIWSTHGMITFSVFNQLKEKQTKMNWWSKSSFRYCNTLIVLTFLIYAYQESWTYQSYCKSFERTALKGKLVFLLNEKLSSKRV